MSNRTDKLTTIAENVPKVYQAGYDTSKKEICDAYMDGLVTWPYANKYAFAGKGWSDETFNPTKSIKPYIVESMFRDSAINDLAGILERNGVTFDFSRATIMDCFAQGSWITNFPLIDASAETDLYYSFAYLTPYEGKTDDVTLPLKVHENLNFSNCFTNSTRLTELRIEGVIGKNINLQSCPLTLESAISVCKALKNFNETDAANAYTHTVTFSSEVLQMLERTYVDDYPEMTDVTGITVASYLYLEKGWNVS